MAAAITDKLKKAFYLDMLRIRVIEEELVRRYPEEQMRCPVHFCIGQEATPVGVSRALGRQDSVMSSHRSHGHYLARGGGLKRMVAELYGKAAGCAKGKGGSMHLIDKSVNFLGATSIVSETIPVAVGVALASKLKNKRSVSAVFFGDAATEEGLFYESLNFAALHRLPVLFVCENNLFSVYTPLNLRQPSSRKIYRVASSLGVKSALVDGNDVESVYRAAEKFIGQMRTGGGGPFLIEAPTYRYLEHCGPNCDIHLGYRTKEALRSWQRRDPVAVYEKRLVKSGLLSEQNIANAKEKFLGEITGAMTYGKAMPFPPKRELETDLYCE